MVDSNYFEGKTTVENSSVLFASQIGSDEPRVIEESPSIDDKGKFNESMTAVT